MSGEQFDIDTAAALIFTIAKSALPCGFRFPPGGDLLHVGALGGRSVAITKAGITHGHTAALLEHALSRTSDEGVGGFVLAVRDPEHGLGFWNRDTGFGRLISTTVFTETEAAEFTVSSIWSQPEWLVMPTPLAHP